MPDLGIGEALAGTALGDLIFGGAAAGAADAGLGIGAGFASDAALTAGGALVGGTAADAGLTAAALGSGAALGGAADAGLTAGEASLLGSAGAASAAPLSATDLALTGAVAGGVPATTDALAAGGFADTLGGVSAGSLGAGGISAGGVASDAAGGGGPLAVDAGVPATTASPGLSSTATSLGATPTTGLGGASTAGPGAGVAAATPGPAAISAPGVLDPTSALAQSQGGNLFSGVVDTTSGSTGGGVGVDTGATFGDSLTPATTGTAGGPVESGAFDATSGVGTPSGGWLGRQLDAAGNYISDNKLKTASEALSLGGLGRSLLTANQANPIPGQADLAALAKQLGQTGAGLIGPNATAAEGVAGHEHAQAATLENYLTSGTLPTPVQDALNRATDSGIKDIQAKYAKQGMPPGSSAEQQDIAALRQSAVIQGGTLAASLYSQGVGLDQLAGQIYSGLVGAGTTAAGAGVGAQESVVSSNTALNTGVNNAIANLSSALGGGSRAIINGNTVTLPAAA